MRYFRFQLKLGQGGQGVQPLTVQQSSCPNPGGQGRTASLSCGPHLQRGFIFGLQG
jgi:hypothetical protein